MGESVQVHKMYKYRLYRCDKKDRELRHMIFVASTIWNHFIALQRRYYRLTKQYISMRGAITGSPFVNSGRRPIRPSSSSPASLLPSKS